ncbi:MAG: hypothetical protein KJP00_15705 [Bacteroidia bacterium]|nr:hypothetical protein [Bacteroidia bacterium]
MKNITLVVLCLALTIPAFSQISIENSYSYTETPAIPATNIVNDPVNVDPTSAEVDYILKAYIGQPSEVDHAKLEEGLALIESAIASTPDRLDWRFLKIHALGVAQRWVDFSSEVTGLVDLSYEKQHQWKWNGPNQLLDDNPKHFLVNTISDYVFMLYNAEDAALFSDIRKIADKVLDHEPDNYDFITYKADVCEKLEDWDGALATWLKAKQFNPEDSYVWSSLAKCYLQKGEKAEAFMAYKKVINYGNDKEKARAKKQLQELIK